MYLYKLYKELRIWRLVKKIAKENEDVLNQNGFRVDWVGRIYTIINFPEEIINQPISHEGYVLMKLREYDKLFLDLGIADVIFPEMQPIDGYYSYLLVLSPNRIYLGIWEFTKFLFKLGITILILRVGYLILNPKFQDIVNLFNKAVDFIF